MRRPVIGITANLFPAEPRPSYPGKVLLIGERALHHAIEVAGGLPVVLPITDELDPIAGYAELIDGLLLSGAPWPIQTADATPPAAHVQIRRERGAPIQWGVLDLPTDAGATMATSRYLFWQSVHRLPIPYGPDARASTCRLLAYPSFRALAALCRRRPDEHARLNLSSPGPGSRHPARLSQSRIRYIVLHHDIDPSVTDDLRAALEGSLGAGAELEGATLWDLQLSGK